MTLGARRVFKLNLAPRGVLGLAKRRQVEKEPFQWGEGSQARRSFLPLPREGAPRAAISASSSRQVKRHKDLYAAPQIGYLPHQLLPRHHPLFGVFLPAPQIGLFPFSFRGVGGRSGQILWSPSGTEGTLLLLPRPQLEGGGEVSRVHKGQMLKKKRAKVSTHPTLPSSPLGKGDSSKNTFEVQKSFS